MVPTSAVPFFYPQAGAHTEASASTVRLTPFDSGHYQKLIQARGETISKVVTALKPALGLANAVDAGCGVGFFAQLLHECGLYVRGFDGRLENVVEARKRFPRIAFGQGNIQDPDIVRAGKFDLVLCFGLLYHLESPLLAIRHLRALTGKGLLLESMCLPGSQPDLVLRDEPLQGDQSLTDIALYPSEGCLVKMLYRAGFAGVYKIAALPDHDDFRETLEHARRRTVLFASVAPVRLPGLEKLAEPREERDPWAKNVEPLPRLALPQRIRRFVKRPPRAKYLSLAFRARQVFHEMPIPLRLPFGAWWLAEKSALDEELIYKSFEGEELRFVEQVLRPGMTVLDVGAHHGLYTLLTSRRVGPRGRVIAFEPSPRERRRLMRHLRVNNCANVSVVHCALGDRNGEADLFLVEGRHDWFNSLRPPVVEDRTSKVSVEVRRLDDVLEELEISRVDFIKLDVEGAELSSLRGATTLLKSASRPAIMAEVQDLRTRPWGYPAREIILFLVSAGYRWFALTADSKLQPVSTDLPAYDANLVALPQERVEEFQRLLAGSETTCEETATTSHGTLLGSTGGSLPVRRSAPR
jgi:FkbM family methyltransferase